MKSNRFVKPETDVLPLASGETLTVRRKLNYGEQQACFARMYHFTDVAAVVNPARVDTAVVLAYLLDWTLTGDEGTVVPIRDLSDDGKAAMLAALDPAAMSEIKAAIDAHADRQVNRAAPREETPVAATLGPQVEQVNAGILSQSPSGSGTKTVANTEG